MRPVEQTELLPPKGNCFAACMASILEMPLDAMPDYTAYDDWTVRWNKWLRPMNLAIMHCGFPGDEQERYRETCMPGYTILAADSPRGNWLHAVVAFEGKIVWDPHPQRDMGLGDWKEVTYFYIIDPIAVIAAGQEITTGKERTPPSAPSGSKRE